jgi:hypothetical protein
VDFSQYTISFVHQAVRWTLSEISAEGRTVEIQWVKGRSGVADNEKADVLAGRAAEKIAPAPCMSLAFLKQRSRRGTGRPKNDGTETQHIMEAKRSPRLQRESLALTGARSGVARVAAQIPTGHWRLTVYLKRIRKCRDDGCWFCSRQH